LAKHPRLAPLFLAAALVATLSAPATSANPPAFALRNLEDSLAMLPVTPGEVVTLAAYDPQSKRPLPVRWTIKHGAIAPAAPESLSERSSDLSKGLIAHGSRDARWKAPDKSGVYPLVGTAEVDGKTFRRELNAFVTVPTAQAKDGVINGYRVGRYPALMALGTRNTPSRSTPSRNARGGDLPEGFIKLDAESRKAKVSRHFTLGQFETKDGKRAEKYMFLSPRLITKLERIIDELNEEGYKADGLRIMSGYRTPAYNSGIGNKTTLSRHTYGDAADILADDWNRDGKITEADARILYRIADRLDRTTDLKGGLSLYKPTSAHGWFVHVDTRGRASRW